MDQPLTAQQREDVLRGLLNLHPDAYVIATNSQGFIEPVPESIKLDGHRRLDMNNIVEVVEAGHRSSLIECFAYAQRVDVSRITPIVGGGGEADLTVVDVQSSHGVVVVVVAPVSGTEVMLEDAQTSVLLTRIASTKKDPLALFLDVDEATTRILGWTREELIGRRSLDFTHPDDQERAVAAWLNTLSHPLPARPVRLRYRRKDESFIWMEIVNHNFLSDPDPHVLAEMIDISEEMAAQETLRDREELLRRLAETLPLGIAQIDHEHRVTYSNDRLGRIMAVEDLATSAELFANVIGDDRRRIDEALDGVLSNALDADLDVQVEVPRMKKSADLRTCSISIRALTRAGGRPYGAILSITDVTESARLQRELRVRATVDELTGCWNRASILSALSNLDRNIGITVVFVDLDRFKPINDRLGHAAGDELLIIVSERLRGAMRTGDLVGRLGGDEFLAVFPGVSDPTEAGRIAARVNDVLCRPAQLTAGTVDVEASIGYTWAATLPQYPEDLVAQADAAMFEAKRLGSGHPVAFRQEISTTTDA